MRAYLRDHHTERHAELAAAEAGARLRTGCPYVRATTVRGHVSVEVAFPLPGADAAVYALVEPTSYPVAMEFLDRVDATLLSRALRHAARARQEDAHWKMTHGQTEPAERAQREAAELADWSRRLVPPGA